MFLETWLIPSLGQEMHKPCLKCHLCFGAWSVHLIMKVLLALNSCDSVSWHQTYTYPQWGYEFLESWDPGLFILIYSLNSQGWAFPPDTQQILKYMSLEWTCVLMTKRIIYILLGAVVFRLLSCSHLLSVSPATISSKVGGELELPHFCLSLCPQHNT